MNVKRVYLVSGWLSVVVGIFAALSVSRMQFLFYGVALATIGFTLSAINLYLNAKYFSEQEKFPKGYLGIFLNSLPVIFMLLIVFKFRH